MKVKREPVDLGGIASAIQCHILLEMGRRLLYLLGGNGSHRFGDRTIPAIAFHDAAPQYDLKDNPMEKLDEALANLRKDLRDQKKQSEFYDLFLNATFFVPILDDAGQPEASAEGERPGGVMPVITEAQGNDYLMFFSSLERLKLWTGEEGEPRHIEVPGHLLALTTTAPLHWALNVGTDFSKQFHPEEIAWLREAVEHCNAEAAKQSQA